MKTLLGLLSLLALAGPAALLPPVVPDPVPEPVAPVLAPTQAPSQAVEQVLVEDGRVTLVFGYDGLAATHLLDAVAAVDGRPVLYRPAEMADLRLFAAGDLELPAEQLLDVAARLLIRHDVLLFAEHSPLEALRVVQVGLRAGRVSREDIPQCLLTLEELAEPRVPVDGIYSVVLPLEHIDARSAMASFQHWFNSAHSGLRNVENSNSLVLTSPSLETLRHVVAMARVADRPAQGGSRTLHQRVEVLEQGLAALRTELDALRGADDDG